MEELIDITKFLYKPTCQQWINNALNNRDILLVDHAHCEKKAASSALGLIYHYPDKPDLLQKMSRLAREELRHFEQVIAILTKHQIPFEPLEASNYVKGLREQARDKGKVIRVQGRTFPRHVRKNFFGGAAIVILLKFYQFNHTFI